MKTWWAPKFPQIFIRHEDESITYVGDWDDIQELLDCEGLNNAFVKQNHIPTFTSVFGDFISINDAKSKAELKAARMETSNIKTGDEKPREETEMQKKIHEDLDLMEMHNEGLKAEADILQPNAVTV
eukprot:TRINITY_DN1781_c0_g2_i1.p1 TRINITY_DN1781_c0_g2~~TRINITY_DN1781_c0_g2_i1.p1  ORF type:complete len:127 (+),score=34.95 TRINITY_DN1781_c0_g2_i1:94-474(+)